MLKKFCFTLAAIFLIGLDLPAQDITQSKDWPQFRGPHRDGISLETNLLREWPKEGPPLLWNSKKASGKSIGVGYSSISIVDGKIFTMGDLMDDPSDKKLRKRRWVCLLPRRSHRQRTVENQDRTAVFQWLWQRRPRHPHGGQWQPVRCLAARRARLFESCRWRDRLAKRPRQGVWRQNDVGLGLQ